MGGGRRAIDRKLLLPIPWFTFELWLIQVPLPLVTYSRTLFPVNPHRAHISEVPPNDGGVFGAVGPAAGIERAVETMWRLEPGVRA